MPSLIRPSQVMTNSGVLEHSSPTVAAPARLEI